MHAPAACGPYIQWSKSSPLCRVVHNSSIPSWPYIQHKTVLLVFVYCGFGCYSVHALRKVESFVVADPRFKNYGCLKGLDIYIDGQSFKIPLAN